MIELPDDELDKLFRKSSEELDPQYEPEDWDVLKKRLDGHDGRTAGGWLRKWWPAGVLALLIPAALLTYFFIHTPDKKDIVKQLPAQVQTERGIIVNPSLSDKNDPADKAAGEAAKEDFVKTEKTAADNAVASKPAASDLAPATALKRKAKILPRGQSEAGGVYLEPDRSKAGGGDGALIISGESLEVASQKRSEERRGEERRIGGREERKNVGMEVGGAGVVGQVGVDSALGLERMLVGADMLRARPLVWSVPEPAAEVKPVAWQMQDSSASEQQRPAGMSPKWAVRVGYSPDLTSVGFKNMTRVGSAFSALLEYGLTKRLYVQTGLVRSMKDYSAEAGEYKFYDYVTSVNTPYDVDGMCTMYEIPLGIRYDLTQKTNSRWFVGSGFTSYYVQKEKYTYHYKDYVHGQKPGWQGKTGLFLFSHLNASVGYERAITRKLSILAEPYIRIPLKGVGYGKVNLLTTGAWISLRYTPVFR